MFVDNRVPVRKNQHVTKIVASVLNIRTAALSVVGALTLSVAIPVITMAAPMGGTNNDAAVTTTEVANTLEDTTGILAQSDGVATTSDGDSAIKAAIAGASIDIPKDASDGVTLASNGGPTLDIELPNAGQAKDAQAVAPGVVSYPSNNGSANAIQATEDGGVRMLTIIDNPNAPTKYDYKITVPDGGHIELASDGGAAVLDASQELIATVAAPWAKDANGKTIETWFVTDSEVLTQYVRHNVPGVVYPVTADPSISFGWRIYVRLNRSETRYLANRPNGSGFFYGLPGGAGCFIVGKGWIGFTCGAYITQRSAALMDALGRAASMNGCLELAIPYGVYSPTLFWNSVYSIKFSAVRC